MYRVMYIWHVCKCQVSWRSASWNDTLSTACQYHDSCYNRGVTTSNVTVSSAHLIFQNRNTEALLLQIMKYSYMFILNSLDIQNEIFKFYLKNRTSKVYGNNGSLHCVISYLTCKGGIHFDLEMVAVVLCSDSNNCDGCIINIR